MSEQTTPRTVEEAARMPSVEEVAGVLAAHGGWTGLPERFGHPAGTYCSCGHLFEGLHAQHQAERVVALWGGGERG